MDQERVYFLTDRGSAAGKRWITCEYRDAEDHSCHGVLIYKQIFYTVNNNTVTYRDETSADFPITEENAKAMALVMCHSDDMWRDGPGSNIEPKSLRYKIEDK